MLEIRCAREDDLPAVAALAADARDDSPTGAQLGAQDTDRLLEHLSVLLAAGGQVLVAEHNGQVVGVVLGRVVAAYLFAQHASMYLDMLFVSPRARRHGVGHALLRAAADLLPAVEIAISRYSQIGALEAEVADLTERFETRKRVDRAKGLLMTKMGLSEPESFRWIQKTSMDRRLTMREVADAVIEQVGA